MVRDELGNGQEVGGKLQDSDVRDEYVSCPVLMLLNNHSDIRQSHHLSYKRRKG